MKTSIHTTIKASDTPEHQPTVWPVPYTCAQPYHLGSGSQGQVFRSRQASSDMAQPSGRNRTKSPMQSALYCRGECKTPLQKKYYLLLLFLSFSRDKFTILQQNSVTDVFCALLQSAPFAISFCTVLSNMPASFVTDQQVLRKSPTQPSRDLVQISPGTFALGPSQFDQQYEYTKITFFLLKGDNQNLVFLLNCSQCTCNTHCILYYKKNNKVKFVINK